MNRTEFIDSVLKRDYEAKKAADAAGATRKELKPTIEEGFATFGPKINFSTDTEEGHATWVDGGEIAELDFAALKERIPAEVWDSICVQTPDPSRIEAAIVLGRIDQAVVAECTNTKPKAGYVRYYLAARVRQAAQSKTVRRVRRT